MPSKPLLLVDIDGVISLFGFDPKTPPPGSWQMVDGIAHLLSAQAGEHLLALSDRYELVWCSGWEEKANEYLPRALGLTGPLPHLSFDPAVSRAPRPDTHWKLAAIDAYAGEDRPLAWIDDALTEECHRWAALRRGPTLLIATEPPTGITAIHVAHLLEWGAPESVREGAVSPSAAPEAL